MTGSNCASNKDILVPKSVASLHSVRSRIPSKRGVVPIYELRIEGVTERDKGIITSRVKSRSISNLIRFGIEAEKIERELQAGLLLFDQSSPKASNSLKKPFLQTVPSRLQTAEQQTA